MMVDQKGLNHQVGHYKHRISALLHGCYIWGLVERNEKPQAASELAWGIW